MALSPSPDVPPHRDRGGRGAGALLPLLKETASGWVRDNAMRLSAALSLYAVLSLAPLLVITLKIVGVVWTQKEYAREQITRQMTSLMGSQAAEALKPMIDAEGFSYFRGSASALQRHQALVAPDAVSDAEIPLDVGVDQPRVDAVDANALRRHLRRHVARQRLEPELGRRIVRAPRQHFGSLNRADVHDAAFASLGDRAPAEHL